MATSSGSKPTTEERLASLEANWQHLKHQLNNLDDFLQNLDIDAGRHLEMLEEDITSTKFGLSEELGKLCKDLKDPKHEFEERVNKLEQQMEQLNKEWKQERDQSKKGGSK
jgi:predicted  nucleic acid-binding Zn-ribbon protein